MKTGKIPEGAEFWIVGACRGADDEAIVDSLKEMAKDMDIADSVKFLVNQPRSEIINVFKAASIALHTMKYEHFGISIVEMMAAGIITIAHNSAGPK
jgi:alpha-1,2-mannosyltransferase